MKCLLAAVAILALTATAMEAVADPETNAPAPCKGTPNTIPVHDQSPTFVRSVPNGKLYTAGQGNDTFAVVHVWGTPYEQGFANGQLRATEIQSAWAPFMAYIDASIERKADDAIPQWLLDLFNKYGITTLLQWSFSNTKDFTPQKYLDEMQGIADGANVSVELIQNMNMFPELTKAACTVVGATKDATPNGLIAHLRALDFSPHMPIKDYAQVTVYHTEGQPTVANVGWASLIGALTGISNTTIGIGEKVWLKKGVDGWRGQPWMFILRDVLLTSNIEEALDTMKNANRTCAIHVGVGDSTTNTFRGVTMAKNAWEVYNSSTLNYPEHPVLDHVMYWDKHAQPTHSYCLSDLLKENYGQLSAKNLALTVAPTSATGDMHCVTFDYEAQQAYIANARKTYDTTGSLPAYNRQFTLLDLKSLWAEMPPSV